MSYVVRSLAEPSQVTWRDGATDWNVEVSWALVEGWLECVGVSLRQGTDHPVALGAATMRRFRLGEVVRQARTERYRERGGSLIEAADAGGLPEDISWSLVDAVRRELRPLESRTPGRPRTDLGREHFAEVAQIYSRALTAGLPPLRAVVREKIVSASTASRWVAEARRLGLLPPTTPGRAGRPATPALPEDQGR